jgi:hypothetical protein
MRRLAASWPILPLLAAMVFQPAPGQVPTSPRLLVPREIRPGEIAPDPGITVPERIIPAPPGSGAEVAMPPRSSEARLPPGGGDPGILAPLPELDPKTAPPPAVRRD